MAVETPLLTHALAADNWMALAGGVKHVSELSAGDIAAVVRPDGTLGRASIVSVLVSKQPDACLSLLAGVGEFLLPPDGRIVTRTGVQRAVDVAAALRVGTAVRVEVIEPTEVFKAARPAGSKRDAYRAALESFPRERIVVPAWVEEELGIGDRIEK